MTQLELAKKSYNWVGGIGRGLGTVTRPSSHGMVVITCAAHPMSAAGERVRDVGIDHLE